MLEQYIEISLTSLSHDGRAIGRINDQKVIFVQNALPGQKILAKITKNKKNFSEAICKEVLEQTPHIIPCACPHANECGGCPIQALAYEQQLFWKEKILKDALQRIAKLKHIPFSKIYASPKLWHYRNKMEFAIGSDSNTSNLILGQRALASHKVIATPNCLIMPNGYDKILSKLKKLMQALNFKPWQSSKHNRQLPPSKKNSKSSQYHNNEAQGLWRHVIIRKTASSPEHSGYHIQLITAQACQKTQELIAKLGHELLSCDLGIIGFVHEERTSESLYAQGQRCITSLGQEHLHETLCDVQYKFRYDSFFQVNSFAAEYLCAQANQFVNIQRDEIIWDLYCGVGAPSLAFAKSAKALYGLESNSKAIEMAEENAQNLGLTNCHYLAYTVEDIVEKISNTWPKPHIVIADPPRVGMDFKVIQGIMKVKPKRILYISCNPATLARDIALLSQDYELKQISAIDLFPHTAHIESCALLMRKNTSTCVI